MMVWSLFIIDLMGLFFYTKIGSIRSIGDLPTTNIIEPKILDTMRFIVGRITSFSPEIEFFSHLFLLYLRIFEDSILENNYGVLIRNTV